MARDKQTTDHGSKHHIRLRPEGVGRAHQAVEQALGIRTRHHNSKEGIKGVRVDQGWILISEGPDVWTIVASLSGTLAALAATIGLLAAWKQLRQNEAAIQLQVFESVFRDIRDLEHRRIEFSEDFTPEQWRAWNASFFNTVEYLVFLMNRKVVRNNELHEFFKDALPGWCGDLQARLDDKTLIDGPKMFAELKQACRELSQPKETPGGLTGMFRRK